MTRLFAPFVLLISLALCSCFETGQQRPHLTAPSPAAVHKSVDKLEQHIDKASDNTKALKTTLAKAVALAGENKELRVTLELANGQIDTLSAELLGAKNEVGVLRSANADLEKKVGEEIGKGNDAVKAANHLTTENARLHKITDQVDRYWGIGGILYGFARLLKHLFILAAVLVAVGVALFTLSFFFPVIGVAFSAASAFVKSLLGRLKK